MRSDGIVNSGRVNPASRIETHGEGQHIDVVNSAECADFTAQEERCAGQIAPYRVTRFYHDQIRRSAHFDRLKCIVEPSAQELQNAGQSDTSGEHENTVMQGLQHKYPQTVLVLATTQCFSHCRFCFRKRLHDTDSREVATDYTAIARYIQNHPETNNVLLSGGDPLTISTDQLHAIVEPLLSIPHLTAIRFGSRAMVYYPPRFRDRHLIALFERIVHAGKRAVLVCHIDHVDEISEEAAMHIEALRKVGVQFLNQAVLLKGINDDPEVLAATFEKLHRLGVYPYYLFQARPVKGALHFQVDLRRGVEILHAVNRRSSGIQKTFRYVMSHTAGKTEILDIGSDNRIYLRRHQSKDSEKVGGVFSRPYREGTCWMDDLSSE